MNSRLDGLYFVGEGEICKIFFDLWRPSKNRISFFSIK